MGKSIVATESGGSIYLPPEDSHVGRCVLLADLGTQPGGNFGPKHQIIIGFELPLCLHVFDEHVGEEPAMLSRFFTLSLNEASNLRAFLEGWRSKGFTSEELKRFELMNLVGAPALLSVVHAENKAGQKRATIASASKIPKGMEVPKQVLPSRTFAFSDPSVSDFEAMPNFIQERIKEAAEYRAWYESSAADDAGDVQDVDIGQQGDEVPF